MAPRHAQTYFRYIAANLVRLRRTRGLTQEQLAESLALPARYLQKLERAEVNLGVEMLVRVARALDVDPRALLRPAELKPPMTGRPRTRSTSKPSTPPVTTRKPITPGRSPPRP